MRWFRPVARVDLDWPRQRATAFVPADQSELARGDDGLNQQLASELTGWTIEVATTDSA